MNNLWELIDKYRKKSSSILLQWGNNSKVLNFCNRKTVRNVTENLLQWEYQVSYAKK